MGNQQDLILHISLISPDKKTMTINASSIQLLYREEIKKNITPQKNGPNGYDITLYEFMI